jgi:hypothetical protein
MTPTRLSRILPWAAPIAFLGALVLALLFAGKASAGPDDRPTRKMERQISAFERMVDEALVDSPNFLVPSRDEARGLYMDGYGLIVTFQSSLTGNNWNFNFSNGKWWNHWMHDDDDNVIVINGDDFDDDDLDELEDLEHLDKEDRATIKKLREKAAARQAKKYERGKTELIDVFLDHSELLSTLKDTDWLELQASLKDAEYFRKNDLHRLVLKAKMSDLRLYSENKISEDEMIKRIQTKES